jgi:hypothetical protein
MLLFIANTSDREIVLSYLVLLENFVAKKHLAVRCIFVASFSVV